MRSTILTLYTTELLFDRVIIFAMSEPGEKFNETAQAPLIDEGLEEVLLQEARIEVGHADTKASFVLAGLSIGFSALLSGILSNDWRPTDLEPHFEFIWWVGAVLAMLSVVSAVSAVWPRTGDSSLDRPVYYWGQVAQMDEMADLSDALNSNPPVRAARTRDQIWHLSQLVARKYRWVRVAIVLGGIAALAFAVVGLGEL